MKVKGMKHGIYEIYWNNGGSSIASVGFDQQGYNWYAPCNWVSGSTNEWRSVKAVKLLIPNDYTKSTKGIKSSHIKTAFNSDNFKIESYENS